MRVRAEVVTLNELSAHADQQELLRWMRPMVKNLKKVFLIHGEPAQSGALAGMIKETYGLEVVIPGRGQSHELS